MRPNPAARIAGMAARQARNTAVRLSASASSQSSSGISSTRASVITPALLTRIVTGPSCRAAAATSSSGPDRDARSVPIATASPSSAAKASAASRPWW
jgi:hypothetical protein